jgi:hypothetical protein
VKISILAIILIGSFSLYSSEGNETSYNLFVYNQHGKVLKIEEVKIVKENVFVNGERLSPVEVTIKSKYLNSIFRPRTSAKTENCSAGKYIFRMSSNKKDSIENGCLETKRYAEITKIFDRFKPDVVLK